MQLRRCVILLLVSVFAAAVAAQAPSWADSDIQRREEELGRKYAEEAERDLRLLDGGDAVDRVRRVGEAIAAVANGTEVAAGYGSSEVCKFHYQFKVVEDEDVNAFSLPGGIIYINTGLLKLAQTDDELAGVLAHEIAHSAHHHISYLVRKQSKVDRYVALVALAGILGNMRNQDLNNLLFGVQLLKVAKISGYTQEAERDADRTAVAYLTKSSYDPRGMLSFMQKLEKQHQENPTASLGIFQTHPAPFKRVLSIAKAMEEQGLEVNTRQLQDIAFAKPVPIREGSDRYQVVISDRVLYEPKTVNKGATSRQRAEVIAKNVNALLDKGLKCRDIKTDESGHCLTANGVKILTVEAGDVPPDTNNRALLDKARSALSFAVWADWVCNTCRAEEAKHSDLD